MSYSCFEISIENQIAHITLNRPDKRNSMVPEFWDELPAAIKDIDNNAKARVIVISSTGPHFSSGLDTSVFGSGTAAQGEDAAAIARSKRQHGAKFYNNVRMMQDSFSALENCRIPVLAAIQGGAIGGAVDLITACDMRYMTADAFLTIYEINIGMTADVGTFPRIVKLMPEGLVKELAYTGRRMMADEAKAVGICNAVYDDQAAMLAAVMNIAAQIAARAPLAVYGSKRMINYARDHSTADGLDYIAIWNASMLQHEEISESFVAKAEKREPDYVELPQARTKMTKDLQA